MAAPCADIEERQLSLEHASLQSKPFDTEKLGVAPFH